MTAIGGQGGGSGRSWENGGDGGIAGQGGIIKVSEKANVYAFNGNRYTDGTTYDNGKNQTPIFAQNGILREVYKGTNDSDLFDLLGSSLVITEDLSDKTKYPINNYLIRAEENCNTNGYTNPITLDVYGIGSGAGYIEVSNGTYIVDSGMN